VTSADVRVVVGPTNVAGQGFQIAKSLRDISGIDAVNFMLDNNSFRFTTDLSIPSEGWISSLSKAIGGRADYWPEIDLRTHVISEYFDAFRNRNGIRSWSLDCKVSQAQGQLVSVVAHGSDIRVPSVHAELDELSPHRKLSKSYNALLEQITKRNLENSRMADATFVSTRDLLHFMPNATWLPAIVGSELFKTALPTPSERPIVMHLPSDPRFKGSEYIVPVLEKLHSQGVIRYRGMVASSHEQVIRAINRSHVLVDQIGVGHYGAIGVEAMASGRAVMAYMGSLGADGPVINIRPETIESELVILANDLELQARTYKLSREFAEKFHNGNASVKALEPFLALRK
jgi:hypothetical protein